MISYDPDNHHHMTLVRQAKVAGIADDIPPLDVEAEGDERLLVVGWGSTYGPIRAAVRRLRTQGRKVAVAHFRHLNPFPANTGAVLQRFERVVVPEMNTGQLRMLLRAEYLVDAHGYNRVRGLPLTSTELAEMLTAHLDELGA